MKDYLNINLYFVTKLLKIIHLRYSLIFLLFDFACGDVTNPADEIINKNIEEFQTFNTVKTKYDDYAKNAQKIEEYHDLIQKPYIEAEFDKLTKDQEKYEKELKDGKINTTIDKPNLVIFLHGLNDNGSNYTIPRSDPEKPNSFYTLEKNFLQYGGKNVLFSYGPAIESAKNRIFTRAQYSYDQKGLVDFGNSLDNSKDAAKSFLPIKDQILYFFSKNGGDSTVTIVGYSQGGIVALYVREMIENDRDLDNYKDRILYVTIASPLRGINDKVSRAAALKTQLDKIIKNIKKILRSKRIQPFNISPEVIAEIYHSLDSVKEDINSSYITQATNDLPTHKYNDKNNQDFGYSDMSVHVRKNFIFNARNDNVVFLRTQVNIMSVVKKMLAKSGSDSSMADNFDLLSSLFDAEENLDIANLELIYSQLLGAGYLSKYENSHHDGVVPTDSQSYENGKNIDIFADHLSVIESLSTSGKILESIKTFQNKLIGQSSAPLPHGLYFNNVPSYVTNHIANSKKIFLTSGKPVHCYKTSAYVNDFTV